MSVISRTGYPEWDQEFARMTEISELLDEDTGDVDEVTGQTYYQHCEECEEAGESSCLGHEPERVDPGLDVMELWRKSRQVQDNAGIMQQPIL